MAVTNEDLRELRLEYQRRYVERHPEKVKAARQSYYQRNKAKILAYQNEYNRKKTRTMQEYRMKISWPGGSGTGTHKLNNDDEARQLALETVSHYPLNAKCEVYRLYDDGHEQYVGAAEHVVRLCL